ncbi:uncharacterized protein LOC128874246 [Hylaeus volcanicus]|uniref:uncharacterized protein LOC128874246 n=1 Tax=Hylaeus volcanicus TaxID=313075 RepID=UPI0023B7ACC6|nr:uncharacterized protein LOC128874246 [Hylaeus volcanicus]
MHKKTHKRSILNSVTQKVKATENLPKIRDYKDNENESSDHFQLPSLQKKKAWKDIDDRVSIWNESTTATCVSYSSELEDIATRKVIQQWEAIENTLYEDGDQVTQTALLEECIQWRTQIPHLRIVGKNSFLLPTDKQQDPEKNYNQIKDTFDSLDEDIFSEHNFSIKERRISSKYRLQSTQQDKVFDMLFEYVMSELFPNKENGIDSLGNELNDVLQIRMAPVHSNKSSAKSTKLSWFEETIPLENKFPNSRSRGIEAAQTKIGETPKKYDNLKHNDRIKSGRDTMGAVEDKLFRPHTSRNKLGTVFNEKIVVSPVPYILSTRESFSTIKTTPIKFMGQTLDVTTFPGSSRNISYFKNSGKNSTATKLPNYQSAWHASVSPARWPTNIRLAPLDTSRLPNTKNRSLTSSSVVLQRNRKPLSPISRSTLPYSAQTTHNNNEALEIQGRHIIPGQSPKLSMDNTGWDYNARSRNSKKKRGQSITKI